MQCWLMKLFQDETRSLTVRAHSHAHHALLDDAAGHTRPGITRWIGKIILTGVNHNGAIDNGMSADQRERHALHYEIHIRHAIGTGEDIACLPGVSPRTSPVIYTLGAYSLNIRVPSTLLLDLDSSSAVTLFIISSCA